ncbi:hypothetical protein niasHS_009537 [Heterodera schachtii]|uniref:BTB domain-containing protein n=1 Tax=Heterodera schachtii TaxID=97005 RepID=A0ABD2JCC2_HETSC
MSTGEHSDVHFLVGEGDEKEVLPAHQLILKSASDVFEAMFRFDAKKERVENVSDNCPDVVEIPDIEAAEFKVMLSFIYTKDLSDLNGDNAMAVLYAAKKYNIPDLVNASLQIPISELRNVFFAYAQAQLFDLEDFSFKCLRYICQNAAQLFGSDDFLQIDQKMLCSLLGSDRLLLSDEFEIWKAALRWADEKCRQNGIKCSAENCRSALGPALFKIRFPNIHEEDFAKFVVPSGVLTTEEVLGVYQFNSHPYLHLRGVPGLYSLKFPSHGRIFNWNKAKGNKKCTVALEIEKVSEFAGESVWSRRLSDAVEINGLAWKIEAEIQEKIEGTDEKCLVFYLWCDAKEEKSLDCVFSATLRIVSEKSEAENSIGTRCDCVINRPSCSYLGFRNFITFAELMDQSNGFYNKSEDKVTLVIDVITVDEPKVDKFILNQSKSNGTISMEIEKVSEFGREIFESERKSETVHIKGFPWKIFAQIEENYGSTDNNEKWLGFYLLCDAPEEDGNWSCKVSPTFRIVSQKKGADNSIGTFCDHVLDNESNNIGFGNFISFVELMEPSNGFYNKSEDKVTLVIDVITVDEPKVDKCISFHNKSNGTISMGIENVSEFAREIIGSERKSETVQIKGFPWKIWAAVEKKDESTDNNEKWLGFYLLCDAPEKDKNWSCKCLSSFLIVSQKSGVADYKKEEFTDELTFNSEEKYLGYTNFISFMELMDEDNGLWDKSKDKVTLVIDVITVDEPSNGTISMGIEKVSEFAREIIGSEHKSETVYIKGFPWKIFAQISPKNGSTDSNEKWLYISLLCDAPEKENWSCKCSGNVRIVSQKNGVLDFKQKFVDLIFDNENMYRCVKFISFAELMDPSKGLYDKKEDKLTLAIDVTVKEAKMEDKS